MTKNIENYFDELDKKIEAMSDEEFMELLIKAGIENCPLLENYNEEN